MRNLATFEEFLNEMPSKKFNDFDDAVDYFKKTTM